ncbi:MAG: SRPBCC family protein [Actinomycetota bacterium]
MRRLQETIEVARPIEEAFDEIADFSTTASWDPGIAEARRLDEAPLGVGSRFEVVAMFNARELPLVYEIVEYERPTRVVLRGSGATFQGLDEITCTREGDNHTRIDYVADLRLTGLARLAEPLLGGRFDRMGKDAVRGLKRHLERRTV